MANIKLKGLLTEVEDFKARSKETGKLVHFKSKDSYNAALKAGTHEDPKDKKDKTPKASAKPNDMFGGDYAKDRGGEAPKADTAKAAPKADVKSIIKNLLKTADKEFGKAWNLDNPFVRIANVIDAEDADGKELKARLDKGEKGTYVQTDETGGVVVFNDGTQYQLHHAEDGPIPVTKLGAGEAPKASSKKASKSKASVDGQTDDELYDALYDMGYDFGELGSDDFDEEGFADAAMNLGYRYDDKNKVWNHRDKMGGDTPNTSKYDDKSYWKDTEREKQGQGADDDWDDDDSWGEGPQLTSDRLDKIETALEDELDLRGNGFETTRESGGGMGGWEGPMQIMDKNADFDDEDNYITLSVGSSNNDGKMSIVFANYNGEPYFEPDYDALTGDNDLEPQQAYKVAKALMKMPEVQKLLKGEMSKEEFQPIYDKLKAKFSKGKTESTKLTSMIKK